MTKLKYLLPIVIALFIACGSDTEIEPTIEVNVLDFLITIDENPSANYSIGTIQATTNQGSLSFSITEQLPNNAFTINTSTGEITVLTESLFDFETNPTITGTVKVENGDVFKAANITINLNDVNEIIVSVSDLEAIIDENPLANQSIGTVQATTNQGNLIYSITEQSPNNAIAINATTGEITVLNKSLFDFETNPTITGTVKVENGDIFDTANITINLNDINEPNLQARLNNGETPFEIYQSDNSLLTQLYGLNYQGGLIFYLNTTEGTGLITANENQKYNNYEITDWGCEDTSIPQAENTSVGSGLTNTNSIISSCSTTGIAAEVCVSLQLNGFSDWFLPSKDELDLMYKNLHINGLGNFKEQIAANIPNNQGGSTIHNTIYYWSSSQSSNNNNIAWVQTFSNGNQYDIEVGIKSLKHMIRAIRAF